MRIRLLLALAVSLALARSPALAAPPSQYGPLASANVEVVPGRPTQLQVTARADEPAIGAALARLAHHAPSASASGVGWTRWTVELPAPSRRGLIVSQDLPLGPLLALLRDRGEVSLTTMIHHPRVGFIEAPGATLLSVQRDYLSASIPSDASRPLRLEMGWRPADVQRAIAILLLAFFGPLAAGWLIERRSLAHDRVPHTWFARAQAIHLVAMAGWVLWMVAVEATQISALTEFAADGRGGGRFFSGPLWVIAFLPAALMLGAMIRRIARRLRGHDALPRMGLMGRARLLSALVLILVAVQAFVASDFRVGVFSLIGALCVAVLLPGPRGPLGLKPQALSSGALRDRLFDLAHRAGVKLRELYVVPMRRQRMANAFAVTGGVVMVADELLDRMSRREVDAVLAHEITHLEHNHPRKSLFAALLVWVLFGVGASSLSIPYGFPVTFVLSWLTYLFFARRFEYAADAGAAALTGDPEAMISGLGHLARLNDAPLAWSGAWRWLITHPTTAERGMAIGRRAGIAPERVAELLSNGLPPGERYELGARPGESERVFSTAWKTATLGRLSLAMLAAAIIAPAALLAFAQTLRVPVSHGLAIVAGAGMACAAVLFVYDQVATRVVRRLQPALRRRFAAAPGDALFVALSPGHRPRIYEGLLDWDLGFLTIERDRLRFQGEQITLELPRGTVRVVELGAAAPSWIRAPRAIVRWRGPNGDETVALRIASCRRVSSIRSTSRDLAARLNMWRDTSPSPGLVGPPGIGPVTARTPAEAAAPRDLSLLVILLGTLAAGASFVLGFDLWRGLDLFAAAFLGVIAVRWPAMTWRERAAKPATPELQRRAA